VAASKQADLEAWETALRAVGDTENGPESDILGQAILGIKTDHRLDFPA
jgi:hypothetical protein